MNVEPWTVYRTRFVVCARQLTEPLFFTDALGREHSGQPGDYLVESSQGFRRITPRALFEDIYVPLTEDQPAPQVPGQCSGTMHNLKRSLAQRPAIDRRPPVGDCRATGSHRASDLGRLAARGS